MDNKVKRGENASNSMEVDRATEISNKNTQKRKLNKKQKQWSKLEADTVWKEKIYRPNDIEKKFVFIKNNNDLLLKKSDCLTLENILSYSIYNYNVEYCKLEYIETGILPYFQDKLKEFVSYHGGDTSHIKRPLNYNCHKQKLLKANVIAQILKETSGQQISLKTMKELYENKTNFKDFSITTLRKFVRQRMNLRYRRTISVNIKRKQYWFQVMNHLFAKKFIEHIYQNKTFIFIDETSFHGYNFKHSCWQDKNNLKTIDNYGRKVGIILFVL